jgi:hypothetical protein
MITISVIICSLMAYMMLFFLTLSNCFFMFLFTMNDITCVGKKPRSVSSVLSTLLGFGGMRGCEGRVREGTIVGIPRFNYGFTFLVSGVTANSWFHALYTSACKFLSHSVCVWFIVTIAMHLIGCH